jgi:hypothetical protein
MSFVAAAASVGAAVGLSGTAAVIGGGMLIGAGVGAVGGGLYSAVTGDGDVGQSMLYGGLGGAALGGGYAAAAPAAGATGAAAGAPVSGAVAAPVAEGAATGVGGMTGAEIAAGVGTPATSGLPAGAGFTTADAASFAPGWSSAGYGGGAPVSGATTGAGGAGGAGAATQGGITGGDVLAGTGALMYLTQKENSKYGVPDNQTYDGPLTGFNYSRENYTPLTTAQPSPAYKPVYANYKTNPYGAAQGGIIKMAEGGIAMANPSVGPVEQMSRDNAVGQNQMFPQAGINSPAFATATNRPVGQNVLASAADTNVDPYTGAERFAEGGIAATPEAQARPAQISPNQITQNSVNYNNALMQRLQGAVNSPQVQQSLTQNPLQQAPAQAYQPMPVQAQPYTTPTFTRPDVAPIAFGNGAVAIPGTSAYNSKIAAAAESQRIADALMNSNQLGDGQFYAAGGKTTSNMAAIDDYVTQYKSDPAGVAAKAKAGDWNAMLAMNKIKGTPNQNYAAGGDVGHLGGYAAGGNPRLLKGPGDGMSDNIPATIGGKQPARLADGEFVVPADVVSHLGNGSTDAGAKHLYSMMDKIRKARTGNKKQGKQIKADKFLPK